MDRLTASVLLMMLLSSAGAQNKLVYILDGGTVVLVPPYHDRIYNVLWQRDGDLVAQGAVNNKVSYYNTFIKRTTLDTTTGRLEIGNMRRADSGLYTVEINKRIQDQNYQVEVIKEVPQPTVWVRPVSLTYYILTCDGDVREAEPVTYSWREGDGPWKLSAKDLIIIKMSHGKTFSCRMTNPFSTKDSEPKDNPFLREEPPARPQEEPPARPQEEPPARPQEEPPSGPEVWRVVFRVWIHVTLSGIIGYFMWRKRDALRRVMCPHHDEGGDDDST